MRYVTLAFVVAATAVALTLALAGLVGLEYGFSAGMLAGAVARYSADWRNSGSV